VSSFRVKRLTSSSKGSRVVALRLSSQRPADGDLPEGHDDIEQQALTEAMLQSGRILDFSSTPNQSR